MAAGPPPPGGPNNAPPRGGWLLRCCKEPGRLSSDCDSVCGKQKGEVVHHQQGSFKKPVRADVYSPVDCPRLWACNVYCTGATAVN